MDSDGTSVVTDFRMYLLLLTSNCVVLSVVLILVFFSQHGDTPICTCIIGRRTITHFAHSFSLGLLSSVLLWVLLFCFATLDPRFCRYVGGIYSPEAHNRTGAEFGIGMSDCGGCGVNQYTGLLGGLAVFSEPLTSAQLTTVCDWPTTLAPYSQ